MSVDLRTRSDGEQASPALSAADFFAEQLPARFEQARELLARGAAWLGLRPLALAVDGSAWTLSWESRGPRIQKGMRAEAARWTVTSEQLADLVHDQATPMTFFTGGTLDMTGGGLRDALNWWLVLRAALDERPIYTPGGFDFAGRDGRRLDLAQTFRPDDSPEEMSKFLHEAGYLHIAGLFEEELMREISADMDRAVPEYREGDGRSWWTTTADGERRVVRLQSFDEKSPATAALLESERFLALASIPGDGHVHRGLERNRIEALFKPIGVTEGISDVPWHKDCSLGRHSYECCSMTTGISVTGAGPRSGQLRVVAGSHRALVWPALLQPGLDLPQVALPTRTGDVTLHLSCTLHMAQPPETAERRVMYTSFRLPLPTSDATVAARAKIRAVREGAYTTVSQEPASGRQE